MTTFDALVTEADATASFFQHAVLNTDRIAAAQIKAILALALAIHKLTETHAS